MNLGSGNLCYEWNDNWVTVPESDNGRTHGVVVTEENNLIIFQQSDPAVLVYDSNGIMIDCWGDRFQGAHGMTLVKEHGHEHLWLTDQYTTEVVKTTLTGRAIQHILKPEIPAYKEQQYSPTWVAVSEADKGGNGDIWVADGYGASLVHRYDKKGNYISTLTGEEGAGKFNCPHSLFIDYRKAEPELYIADRGNKQFQIYDLEGKYKRSFGKKIFTSPCGGAVHDNLLYVPELLARIAVLDENDKLMFYLGENEKAVNTKGWPDHPHNLLKQGKFNSPHYLTLDKSGNIFVVEWILGGRVTRLKRQPI